VLLLLLLFMLDNGRLCCCSWWLLLLLFVLDNGPLSSVPLIVVGVLVKVPSWRERRIVGVGSFFSGCWYCLDQTAGGATINQQ
jgi:hypothetical protein